mmetsp:Transcript_9503/g.23625  ORF Transcript_9503/g.23625 Transcript_9503/m.23625 type:complete len:206 (+) Transcript_9503:27-644(+)
MAALGDTTSSLFVSKSAFEEAARECALDESTAATLWAKLASSSTQRIIGGATAPRNDAANVNNWHWSEVDLAAWAKKRLEALLVGVAAEGVPNKGWVRVTKLESCTGDASVSNRKGKRIVAFELNAKFKWEGQVDYDDVSGELLLPYISEDVADADYELKLTAKDPKDSSHKAALKLLEKQRPVIKERLATFTREIYDDTPKEVP